MSPLKSITLVLALILLSTTTTFAAKKSYNDLLEVAASACEDMIEIAAADGLTPAKAKIAELKQALLPLRKSIPAPVLKNIDDKIALLDVQAKGQSVTDLSLTSVETFHDIISVMDHKGSKTAGAVALLDYAGFKLAILTEGKTVDWSQVAKTSDDAQASWRALQPHLKDNPGITDALTTISDGIADAAQNKDTAKLHFAAKVLLDSVDLVENALAKGK